MIVWVNTFLRANTFLYTLRMTPSVGITFVPSQSVYEICAPEAVLVCDASSARATKQTSTETVRPHAALASPLTSTVPDGIESALYNLDGDSVMSLVNTPYLNRSCSIPVTAGW